MALIDKEKLMNEMNTRAEEEALDFRDIRNMVEFAPTVNAIPIPEKATNGDMIKAMFGSPIREGESEILHMFTFCNGKSMFPAYFYKGWWNSPYKREK